MKLSLKKSCFLSYQKLLGDGQVAIKFKMRAGIIWQRAPIVKLERSIFLVWALEKSIFLVMHSYLLWKSQNFIFKTLVPSKALEVLLCLLFLLTV